MSVSIGIPLRCAGVKQHRPWCVPGWVTVVVFMLVLAPTLAALIPPCRINMRYMLAYDTAC